MPQVETTKKAAVALAEQAWLEFKEQLPFGGEQLPLRWADEWFLQATRKLPNDHHYEDIRVEFLKALVRMGRLKTRVSESGRA